MRPIDSQITAFDTVKEFIYLFLMISVWRSNAGSLLPTGDTMVSMGTPSLWRRSMESIKN